jgi:hypothetical protein
MILVIKKPHVQSFKHREQQVNDHQQQKKGKRLEVMLLPSRRIIQRQLARSRKQRSQGIEKRSLEVGDEMKIIMEEMTDAFVMRGKNFLPAVVAVTSCECIAAVGALVVGLSHETQAVKVMISSMNLRSLLSLGTLCCPPSLPLLLSQLLKVCSGTALTTGIRRAMSLWRLAS